MGILRIRHDQIGVQAFEESQREYLRLLELQNLFWKQRAKQFWYKEGDTNSRFFYNSLKSRRRNNKIMKLKDEDGKWVNRGPELHNLIARHFQSLFKSSQGNVNTVLDCIENRISGPQNDLLVRKVCNEEVKQAVFSMHPDKSPGPDGLNHGFYQSFWDIIGGEVVKFCDDFIRLGKLQKGLNRTQVTLIPKVSQPTSMDDLRPIALCNVLYKIAAKVLANRLKPLLNGLIS